MKTRTPLFRIHRLLVAIGTFAILASSNSLKADVMLRFDTTALVGTNSSLSPTNLNANVVGGTLTRASGLNTTAGTNSFVSTGVGATNFANALTGDDYLVFTIAPAANYSLTITSVVSRWFRSASGVTNVAWSFVSGYDTLSTNTASTIAVPTSAGSFTNLSGLVTNVTSALEVRAVAWNSGGSGGTLRLVGTNGSGSAATSFEGSTTLRSASSLTWDGGRGNGSWTAYGATNADQANWNGNNTPLNGDSLLFVGTTQTNTTNDVSSLLANAIVFSDTAGTFAISGNALTVSNGITNLSANAQTFSNAVTLGAAQTFNASAGNITFAGNITNGGNLLTVSGSSNSTFSGAISGAGGLTKNGAGTLTLSGNNTFGGVLTVAEGKLTVSSVNNASEDGVLGNSANAVVLGASGQTGFLHYVGNTNASTDKTFTAATGGTAGIEASNAATTLTLSGAIGGAGNVQKGGAGTLLLAGNNTFTGALNVHDGTLEIASINNNSANGTLGNSTNPVSLGKSGTANVSTLHYTGGTASTTKGFSMASDATAGVINVANSGTTLTVSGQITGSSGSGLTKTGIGRLSLSGSSSYNGATTVSAGELNLSGGSITNSAVTVASGASLSGYGSVGTIGGAGAINPGNSPGILTTPQVNPSGGTDFNLEMTGTSPTYNNAASSVNDVIRITGVTPFSEALVAGNGINIYFSGAALFIGSPKTITGGFFTGQSTNFASSITNATYNYYFADAGGSTIYNGANYYSKDQYETAVLSSNLMTIIVTTVAQTANFGGADISGQVMQVQVVPEPSTYALLGLSAAAFGAYQWRRRRRG